MPNETLRNMNGSKIYKNRFKNAIFLS